MNQAPQPAAAHPARQPDGFDHWLSDTLRATYGHVLDEHIPDWLLQATTPRAEAADISRPAAAQARRGAATP